jgi:hypothetical protein
VSESGPDRRAVREGARRTLAEALQAEVEAYVAAFAAERDEKGNRLVVRNGNHQSREVLTSAGAIELPPRESTTSAPTRLPGSAGGTPRGSCRRGRARP